MERPTIAHRQLGVARDRREGGREAIATASLYIHRKKRERGREREALLMIIFLTPRKMTAITPSAAAVERKEAVTDCRPLPAEGGREPRRFN